MWSIPSAFSNASSGTAKSVNAAFAKNLNRLQVSFALVNLYTKQRQLLRSAAA